MRTLSYTARFMCAADTLKHYATLTCKVYANVSKEITHVYMTALYVRMGMHAYMRVCLWCHISACHAHTHVSVRRKACRKTSRQTNGIFQTDACSSQTLMSVRRARIHATQQSSKYVTTRECCQIHATRAYMYMCAHRKASECST